MIRTGAIETGLRSPQGVAVRGATLAVADTGHHQVAIYDLSGSPNRTATLGLVGTDPASEGLLFPSAVCFASDTDLVVADTRNRHLDVYKLSGTAWSFSHTIDPAEAGATPGYVVDVAADGSGGVLVLDASMKRVTKVDPATSDVSTFVADTTWLRPTAIAFANDVLYVADADRHMILRYSAGGFLGGFGQYGRAPGELHAPQGLSIDTNGDVHVAERGTARVSTFSPAGAFKGVAPFPHGQAHDAHKLAVAPGGALYVADAAADSIQIFDLAVHAGLSASHTVLDFGAVGLGYTLQYPVLLDNGTPAAATLVSAEVAGASFHPAAGLTAPTVVAAGQKREIQVAFSPTQPGPAHGTLLLTTDGASAPLLSVALRGDGISADPVNVALVLDTSGSMSQPSGATTKVARLVAAASLFVELTRTDSGDEMSAVRFSGTATVLVPRTVVEAATVESAVSEIEGIVPDGLTSIGAGLELAALEAEGSELAGATYVVFSDGKENTPPAAADISLAEGSRVFTVGLGDAEYLDVHALEQLSSVNGGYFQVTDGTDPLLAKFFIQVAADLGGQQTAVDPLVNLTNGETRVTRVAVAEGELRLTFVASWDRPDSAFELEVRPPRQFQSQEARLAVLERDTYLVGSVDLTNLGDVGIGEWEFALRAGQVDGSEPVITNVTVDSPHRVAWNLSSAARNEEGRLGGPKHAEAAEAWPRFPTRPRTPTPPVNLRVGDSLIVQALPAEAGLTFERGEVWLTAPAKSLARRSQEVQDVDLDTAESLTEEGWSERASERIALSYDKTSDHGERLVARVPLAGSDGVYRLRASVSATTPGGNRVTRERDFQLLVRP